jgi:hypothetical protein
MADEPATDTVDTVTISREEFEALKLRPTLDPIQENMIRSLRQNMAINKGELDPQALSNEKSLHDPAAISARESLEKTRYRPRENGGSTDPQVELLTRIVLELDSRITALETAPPAFKPVTRTKTKDAIAET